MGWRVKWGLMCVRVGFRLHEGVRGVLCFKTSKQSKLEDISEFDLLVSGKTYRSQSALLYSSSATKMICSLRQMRSTVRLTRSMAKFKQEKHIRYLEYVRATFLHYQRRRAIRRPAKRISTRRTMPFDEDSSTGDISEATYRLYEDQSPLFWMAVNDWGMDPYDAYCHVEGME